MDSETKQRLTALCEKWRSLARWKLRDAELEPGEMGRKLIKHGAVCYYNCFRDLEDALQECAGQFPASKTPAAPERSTKPRRSPRKS